MDEPAACLEVPRVRCDYSLSYAYDSERRLECGGIDQTDRTWFSCRPDLYVEFSVIMAAYAYGWRWYRRSGGTLPSVFLGALSCGTLTAMLILMTIFVSFTGMAATLGVEYAGNMLTTTPILVASTVTFFHVAGRLADGAAPRAVSQGADLLASAGAMLVAPWIVGTVDNRVFTPDVDLAAWLRDARVLFSVYYFLVPLGAFLVLRDRLIARPSDVQRTTDGVAFVGLLSVALLQTFFELIALAGDAVERELTATRRAGALALMCAYLLQRPVTDAFSNGVHATAAGVILAAWFVLIVEPLLFDGVHVLRIALAAATLGVLVRRRLREAPTQTLVGTVTLMSVTLAVRMSFELTDRFLAGFGLLSAFLSGVVGAGVLYLVRFAPEADVTADAATAPPPADADVTLPARDRP